MKQARSAFRTLQKLTKRRAYVRSAYFHKDKVFLDYFWQHLQQKPPLERARRLQFFSCALELMRKTRNEPSTVQEAYDPHVLLHRFAGLSSDGHLFYIQVKQELRSGKKQLLSMFPARR